MFVFEPVVLLGGFPNQSGMKVLVFLCAALSALDRDGTNVLIKWVVVATVSGPAGPVVKAIMT